jgi:hypothetical protein
MPGLSVHMNQVHKETLSHVENAIPGRSGLDIEIFGMEGVPQEVVDQHNQQVTHKHFEEEQERARVTGNPVRGLYSNGTAPPNKRAKVKESLDEIVSRVAKFRHDKANGLIPAGGPVEPPSQPVSRISDTLICVAHCISRPHHKHNRPMALLHPKPLPLDPAANNSHLLAPLNTPLDSNLSHLPDFPANHLQVSLAHRRPSHKARLLSAEDDQAAYPVVAFHNARLLERRPQVLSPLDRMEMPLFRRALMT